MIQEDGIEMQDEIFVEFEQFLNLEANWPVYFIIGVILALVIAVVIYYLLRMRQEYSEETKVIWKAITTSKSRLPGYNLIRIKPIDEKGELEVRGEDGIYILRSDITRTPYLSEDDKEQQHFESKIETYVYLDKYSKQILGFQISNLFPNETILSKMAYLPVAKFRVGNSKILYLLLVILLVWNFLTQISLFTETPPDFIIQPNMWGWYACVGLLIYVMFHQAKRDKGYWAIFWSPSVTDVEVEFGHRNKTFKKMIPVYYIKPHYHPYVDISSIYDTDRDDIVGGINKDLKRENTKLKSELVSLKDEKKLALELLEDVRIRYDDAITKVDEQRSLAYFEAMKDAQVAPVTQLPFSPGGSSWNMQAFKWPALIGMGGVILYFIIRAATDLVEGISLQRNDYIILALFGLVALGIIIIIFYERIVRAPIFR